MEQTIKYIKVLNWGYVGFSPLTLNPDFESSYKQVEERVKLLSELDYGKLIDESHYTTDLQAYICVDKGFEYGLHFMKNRETILEMIPTMFEIFHSGAKKFWADGIWTDEQYRDYRSGVGEMEVLFEKRLKEFAVLYNNTIGKDEYKANSGSKRGNDKNILGVDEKKRLQKALDKAINKGYIVKEGERYKRVNMTKAQLAYFADKFRKTDGTLREKFFNNLFGEKDLSKASDRLRYNKGRENEPRWVPRGFEKIDELFTD